MNSEELLDIERDLERTILEAMRGDFTNRTDAGAKATAQLFRRRFERWANEYAYQKAKMWSGADQ